nr:MAG TPA: hypothetical protein [Caudoviricetes sp.]
MVFGDNVRARRAARALPRTPTRKRKKKRKRKKRTEKTNNEKSHTHPQTITAIPQPHNHDTKTHTQTNNTVTANTKTGRGAEREHGSTRTPHRTPHAIHNTHHPPPSRIAPCHHTQNRREARMIRGKQNNAKVPHPIRTRGHHSTHHTPPFNKGHRANGRGAPILNEGDSNTRREGHHHSTRPSITMPPHLVMPPHHPQCPHPPPRQGGSRQRIPHHTKPTDR